MKVGVGNDDVSGSVTVTWSSEDRVGSSEDSIVVSEADIVDR